MSLINPNASIVPILLQKLYNSKRSKDLNEFLIVLEVTAVLVMWLFACVVDALCR